MFQSPGLAKAPEEPWDFPGEALQIRVAGEAGPPQVGVPQESLQDTPIPANLPTQEPQGGRRGPFNSDQSCPPGPSLLSRPLPSLGRAPLPLSPNPGMPPTLHHLVLSILPPK